MAEAEKNLLTMKRLPRSGVALREISVDAYVRGDKDGALVIYTLAEAVEADGRKATP